MLKRKRKSKTPSSSMEVKAKHMLRCDMCGKHPNEFAGNITAYTCPRCVLRDNPIELKPKPAERTQRGKSVR